MEYIKGKEELKCPRPLQLSYERDNVLFVNKYLLSAYYIPDTVLGSRDIAVSKTDFKNSCPCD